MDHSHAVRSVVKKKSKKRDKKDSPEKSTKTVPKSLRAMTSEPASKLSLSLPSFSSQTQESLAKSLAHKKAAVKTSTMPKFESKTVPPAKKVMISLPPLIDSNVSPTPQLLSLPPTVSRSKITMEEEPKSAPTSGSPSSSGLGSPSSRPTQKQSPPHKIAGHGHKIAGRGHKIVGHGHKDVVHGHGHAKKKHPAKRQESSGITDSDRSTFKNKSSASGRVKRSSFFSDLSDILQSSTWVQKKEKREQRAKLLKIIVIVIVVFWLVVSVAIILVFTIEGHGSGGTSTSKTSTLSATLSESEKLTPGIIIIRPETVSTKGTLFTTSLSSDNLTTTSIRTVADNVTKLSLFNHSSTISENSTVTTETFASTGFFHS